MGESVAVVLKLCDDRKVEALAVDFHDHETGLDRMAGGEVFARANHQPARWTVGLLGEIGAEAAARGAVADAADDPLGALFQLLLGA